MPTLTASDTPDITSAQFWHGVDLGDPLGVLRTYPGQTIASLAASRWYFVSNPDKYERIEESDIVWLQERLQEAPTADMLPVTTATLGCVVMTAQVNVAALQGDYFAGSTTYDVNEQYDLWVPMLQLDSAQAVSVWGKMAASDYAACRSSGNLPLSSVQARSRLLLGRWATRPDDQGGIELRHRIVQNVYRPRV